MTREGTININADAFADITAIAKSCWDWGSLSFGFEKGAKWADAHPVNPWHKASEELPKENKLVIVAFKFKGEWIYDKGYYADNEWWADSISVLDIIEYWMPIPEIKED